MGFLSNILHGREVSRLEELIKASPAPSLYLRLSQLYNELGDKDKANEIARAGAKMFPESEALSEIGADAAKVKRQADKARVRARIEQYPSPILYTRLAEHHVLDKEFDDALKVCSQGIRAFPEYGGLYSVVGEVALQSGNIEESIEHLEKATSLDKYNYHALMLLAEAYVRNDTPDKGRETLEKILFFAAGDEKATNWLDNFDSRAAELKNKGKPGASTRSFTKPESGGGKAEIGKSSSGVGTSLHVEIREIRRVQGVNGTILIDPYGLVIASDLPEGLDEELSAALITNVCRTVKENAAELTIGEFEEGIIDTEQGHLHILSVAQMTMGVFATKETKAGLLQRAIHTFAERVIDIHH